jgi:hypothetical protein
MTGFRQAALTRRILARAAAVVFGFALAVLLVETALQAAAFVQSFETARRLRDENPANLPTVIFVGDSNIYGLYVGNEETLPKAVERLSSQDGKPTVKCVNWGVPSSPSWAVVEQLERALERKPAAIVVRCGINNLSSMPADEGWGVVEKLRIVKLVRRALFNWRYRDAKGFSLDQGVDGGKVANAGLGHPGDDRKVYLIPPRDGEAAPMEVIRLDKVLPLDEFKPRLRTDFAKMVQLCADRGVPLVLLGYLAGAELGFRDIRQVLQYLDGARGAKLVDPAADLAAAFATGESRAAQRDVERVHAVKSLLLTADRHPTATGYELEARCVARGLRGLGVLAAGADEDPKAYLTALLRDRVRIPELARAGPASYDYAGEPGDRLTVVFGAPGYSYCDGLDLPFDIEPFRKRLGARYAKSFVLQADGAGRARVEIPAEALEALEGARVVACLVQRGGKGGAARCLLSRSAELAVKPR